MTIKQEKFCQEYLKTGNAKQAYINAGYTSSEKSATVNASRLLTNDKVQSRICELSEKAKTEAILSIQDLQEYLTKVIRGLTVEQVVVLVGVGGGKTEARLIEKSSGTKEKLKAAELLLKSLGAFTNKISIDSQIPIVISGECDLKD